MCVRVLLHILLCAEEEEEVSVGRRWVWGGGGGCGEEDKIGRILDWVFRIGLSCTLKFSIT